MSYIIKKVLLSLLLILLGTFVAGITKEFYGHGQYMVIGALCWLLFYTWSKEKPLDKNSDELAAKLTTPIKKINQIPAISQPYDKTE